MPDLALSTKYPVPSAENDAKGTFASEKDRHPFRGSCLVRRAKYEEQGA